MGKGAETVSLVVVVVMTCLCSRSEAIWLGIPKTGQEKCVSEDIHNNVVVLGGYVVILQEYSNPLPTIAVKVTSPFGNVVYHQDNVTYGQFAFTSKESGNYFACFSLDNNNNNYQGSDVSINLEWKIGIAAKDWESVAKKEKIEGVELELRKLGEAVGAIYDNLIYLRSREALMREVSEKTNDRVAWYSIVSLGICIVVSALQLWYLKRYFQKKKLI